jgi:NAD(P)H-dependent flavin oxidoreductase YrpB (nitropropane dioxygenase family)
VIEAAAIEDSKLEGEFKIQDVFPLIAGTRGRQARAQGDAAIWAEMTAMAAMAARLRCTSKSLRNGIPCESIRLVPALTAATRRQAEKDGDPDGGQWSAGQSVGLINDIPTVAELVQVNAVPL